MNESCGCCEGVEKLTPAVTANRPGLDALVYRAGTHATFLETMKARLAGFHLDVPRGESCVERIYPLNALATRESSDPALALLDAWATVGDVLTFYQERIANEGYLRTATERRSVLELTRLIDYSLRPGVASSVFLALTLEKGHSITLQPGDIKAQSLPGPGELPQTFENSEPLDARAEWNTLGPRLSRPQTRDSIELPRIEDRLHRLYLQGVSTNLAKNDPLLIDFGDGDAPVLFRAIEVIPDNVANRTTVKLEFWINRPLRGGMERLQETVTRLITEGSVLSGKTVQLILKELGELNDQIDLAARANDRRAAIQDLENKTNALVDNLGTINVPPNAKRLGLFLDRVIAELTEAVPHIGDEGNSSVEVAITDNLSQVITGLEKKASVPPRNALHLQKDVSTSFAAKADTGLQLVGAFSPKLRGPLQTAVRNVPATEPNPMRVYALRVKAKPFGHNAPLQSKIKSNGGPTIEFDEWTDDEIIKAEPIGESNDTDIVYLDGAYDKLLADSWVVLDRSAVEIKSDDRVRVSISEVNEPFLLLKARTVQANVSRASYGMSGAATRVELSRPWLVKDPQNPTGNGFQILRRTVIYTQSEELQLAEELIEQPICDGTGEDGEIELDGLYSELKAGRWLIISGERADIQVDPALGDVPGNIVTGINSNELVMLAEVRHDVVRIGDDETLPGDVTHTFIKLAKKLEYCYQRSSVKLYANVVKATHGETRNETLGAGDATKPFQNFTLRQPPLTYVASPTPAGADSTLKVYVNDVQWHEAGTLADLGPVDRKFVTRTDDESKTTIVFGNGERGARLPTGHDNIRAVYRNGIGKPGNVRAEQISQLMTRPLGVREVINPLAASGGADRESRDQARKNAPLTVNALDRLVSTEDYGDFARIFAGIGKSAAARFSDGRRELVHVTIAGADDIPIDEHSDLYRNLVEALRKFGDPFQPLKVEVRELMFLVVSAGIAILPDYVWDAVVTNVRLKLLDTFSFERRELGQDALLSEVVSAIQAVRGVDYVDVDVFGGIPEKISDQGTRRLQTPDEILAAVKQLKEPAPRVAVELAGFDNGVIHPAQLAYLTAEVPATLILNQIQRGA